MKEISYNAFRLFSKVLANETRFNIIMVLIERELSVSEICEALNYEQSRVSHNLKCLLNCGFVDFERRGRERVYRIKPEIREIMLRIGEHIRAYEDSLEKCEMLENMNKVVAWRGARQKKC